MINFDDSQCSCSVGAPRTNFEFNDATGYQPQRHSLIRFWVFKKLWPFRSKGVSLFFLINLLQNQGKTSANVWAQLSQMALYRNWDRAIVEYSEFLYRWVINSCFTFQMLQIWKRTLLSPSSIMYINSINHLKLIKRPKFNNTKLKNFLGRMNGRIRAQIKCRRQ